MELVRVLYQAPLRSPLADPLRSSQISALAYDSRRVTPGALFFAFAGAKADGRRFAKQAIEAGAVAVVSEMPPEDFSGSWIEVEHGRRSLSLACRNFFGPPEETLDLNAVTGTNGKTTVTYLMDAIFRRQGWTTGVIGTIAHWIAGQRLAAVNTTPESLDLYEMFARLREAGGTHVSLEASSHALALGRIHAIAFHTAIFTNLSRDHLDFHRSMESYFTAKSLLFQPNGARAPRFAVINIDDEYGRRISPAEGTAVIKYGLSKQAELRAENVETDFSGVRFRLKYGGQTAFVQSSLMGMVNVYNILAACGAGISHGMDLEMIAEGIEQCKAVPGRFERIDQGQPFLLVVDYAHTDDALRNAIKVALTLEPKRVITVFGCGGDRDRSKRPLMGQAAAELSDYVVLTSDNPRSEDPLMIINDVLVGLRRHDTPHTIEPDRRKAIRLAIERARTGDLILVAGKGHETQQVLKDEVVDFDDREVARELLIEMGYRPKQ
jgi:UDP-N-acetylmuramoyl-L-alanyl-D-glutamate--2,6-diaminopimelate ligase